MANFVIHTGDCLDVLPTLPENSVDAIVTDPPYGIAFMGRAWDKAVPTADVWRECLRVLKPGGHLVAFASTRTQHRMATHIEDAGFEIRDLLAWLFGSGFPKSKNVALLVDKKLGHGNRGKAIPTASTHQAHDVAAQNKLVSHKVDAYVARSPESEGLEGWGTALKPALEPITLARKPLDGTVAENVMKWGTGGINIDDCRVGEGARWPANLMHDGSEEVLAEFPAAVGQVGAVTGKEPSAKTNNVYGDFKGRPPSAPRGDKGSAARFFYCSKATKADRTNDGTVDNKHNTVKPHDLMRYLCRLVTPAGGVVLDPFCGSGSTGKAAVAEGFEFIGVELDPAHAAVAGERCTPKPDPDLAIQLLVDAMSAGAAPTRETVRACVDAARVQRKEET